MEKLVLMPQNYTSAGTGTTSLKLSWKKDKNIDQYKLVLYDKKGKKLKTIKTAKNSCKFTGLSKLTTYQAGISAIKVKGKKELVSQEMKIKVSTSPAKVKLKKFTKSSSGKGKVTWNKVKGASGYEIYLKSATGKYKKVKSLANGSATSCSVGKLKKGVVYAVKVRAYRKAGNTKSYGAYSKPKKLR